MNRRKLLFLTAFLLLTFTASTAAVLAGQTQATAPAGPLLGSPHFQLDWNVTGSGGGTVGSALFQVSSTIGQPAVGLAENPGKARDLTGAEVGPGAARIGIGPPRM